MSKNVYIDWSKAPEGTTHAYINEPHHWKDGEPFSYSFFWEKWEEDHVYDWRGCWDYWMATEDCELEDRVAKPVAEEVFEVNAQGGMKETSGKLRWTLLPLDALKEVVKVLEYGARKYSADNWQKVDKEKYKEALWRHWVAYNQGEKKDPETGLSHLAHLLCDGLFLLWFNLQEDKDD
jgi:hypothetical protein